jgi:hypothetical protein
MPLRIESSTLIRRSVHQVSCKLSDEVAILNLDSALYFGLDRVGARVWAALEMPRSIAGLRDEIVGQFDVGPEQLREDLDKFLSHLHEQGLIEIVT